MTMEWTDASNQDIKYVLLLARLRATDLDRRHPIEEDGPSRTEVVDAVTEYMELEVF